MFWEPLRAKLYVVKMLVNFNAMEPLVRNFDEKAKALGLNRSELLNALMDEVASGRLRVSNGRKPLRFRVKRK